MNKTVYKVTNEATSVRFSDKYENKELIKRVFNARYEEPFRYKGALNRFIEEIDKFAEKIGHQNAFENLKGQVFGYTGKAFNPKSSRRKEKGVTFSSPFPKIWTNLLKETFSNRKEIKLSFHTGGVR